MDSRIFQRTLFTKLWVPRMGYFAQREGMDYAQSKIAIIPHPIVWDCQTYWAGKPVGESR